MKYKYRPYESTKDFEELYYKGAGVDHLVAAGLKMGIFKKNEISKKTFELYKNPDPKLVKKLHIEQH